MNALLRLPLCVVLYGCLLLAAAPASAMSSSPEKESEPVTTEDATTNAIKRGEEYEQRDPEADARAAIERGDLRLLGFATRVTNLPGVAGSSREAALDACGVRLLEGFGDVIRSDEELEAMQKASAYAKRYNAVMLEACLGDK